MKDGASLQAAVIVAHPQSLGCDGINILRLAASRVAKDTCYSHPQPAHLLIQGPMQTYKNCVVLLAGYFAAKKSKVLFVNWPVASQMRKAGDS